MRICKVLLVDDEAVILEGLQKLFDWQAHGCELIGKAMDGLTAIQMAEQLSPDLIIIDINLPIVNGLDVIKAIQSKNKQIKFVIVSGYDHFEYCKEALRLNVLDFLLKPVDFLELEEVLTRVLQKKEKQFEENYDLTTGNNNIISEIVYWIREHMHEDITLTKLSEIFHFNSSYLSQMFKNELGVNYHTYLNQVRINQAKIYLKQTDKSISEIAELVGFRDYRVFTKVFKRLTSQLPSQYRKNDGIS